MDKGSNSYVKEPPATVTPPVAMCMIAGSYRPNLFTLATPRMVKLLITTVALEFPCPSIEAPGCVS